MISKTREQNIFSSLTASWLALKSPARTATLRLMYACNGMIHFLYRPGKRCNRERSPYKPQGVVRAQHCRLTAGAK